MLCYTFYRHTNKRIIKANHDHKRRFDRLDLHPFADRTLGDKTIKLLPFIWNVLCSFQYDMWKFVSANEASKNRLNQEYSIIINTKRNIMPLV